MGKIHTKIIGNFSGGRSDDDRSSNFSKYGMASHFNVFDYGNKLVPRKMSVGDNTGDSTDIVKFLYADRSGTEYLFGFDRTAGNFCKVVYWNGSNWGTFANNESSSGARNEKVFFHYKGFIYMWKAGTHLVRFDVTSSAAFNDSYQAITYSNVAQPVHHSADDIAYFFADNDVHKLNDTSWTSNALVLPTNEKIVAACEYGNYLAIATTTTQTSRPISKVYLWDRDSSLTTISQKANFGFGTIHNLADLDGRLIAVMTSGNDVYIKYLNGNSSKILRKLTSTATTMGNTQELIDNRLYWGMSITVNTEVWKGIWAVDSLGRIALDFVHPTPHVPDGIIWNGTAWWYSNAGSVFLSSGSTVTGGKSIYDTLIIGNGHQTYKLLSVGVMSSQSPALNDDVALKYVTNGANWASRVFTTVFDDSTIRYDTFKEAVNIETTGANLPTFKEMILRVEIANANIDLTGLRIVYEEVPDNYFN